MEQLVAALFLAMANNRIVEYLSAPLKQRFPTHNFWWLLYAALLSGAVLGYASGINLFAAYLPNDLAGRILTAIVIGGGSNLIHEIFEGQGGGVTIAAPRATSVESVTTGTVEGDVVTGAREG